ncbi:MAG: glycosyltransferase family 4 protein [Phenylobacterium sp.]
MPGRLAIYNPSALTDLGKNPFGKDVANMGLWRALVRHGGFEQVDVLSHSIAPADKLRQALLGDEVVATRLETGHILQQSKAAAAGALIRGKAELGPLAWTRREQVGDAAYSLLGLVHTIAPPAIRQYLGEAAMAPTHPWDALICTSPAVQQGLHAMFDALGEQMAARFGGVRAPRPHLPLIPLGVDASAFEAAADRPEARARIRAELGLSEGDALVLWVGRLSFFEKAFPQPMFRAVQEAAQAGAARVCFALAGWFPNDPRDRDFYRDAAQAYAPGVDVRFEDGNDRERLADLWAGADMFISLVDNIQETFGITPLEAMAAGLPVVASDWDGYRYTIEHGVQGFLIPTLGGPSDGIGAQMAAPHRLLLESYQTYVGSIAQHTAVHVGKAAEAIAALIASPDLRRRMGQAGRARVRAMFDWPVVAGLYGELVAELAKVRAAVAEPPAGPAHDPLRGDPFAEFAHFATHVLTPQTRLALRPGVGPADLQRAQRTRLDGAFSGFRANLQECARALQLIASGAATSVAEVTAAFPPARRAAVQLGLVWMAKLGLLDWLDA